MLARRVSFCAVALFLIAGGRDARADEPRFEVHVAAAAAAPVGAPKSDQFGWGLVSSVSPELRLARAIGIEVAVGAVALSDGAAPAPTGMTETGWGVAGFSAVGPRVRPFAPLAGDDGGAFSADGFWVSGGVGAGVTAALVRPVIRAEVGYDAEAGIVRAGPYLGFFQMVGMDDDLRPEDARVGMVGLHGSFGSRPVPAPKAERPAPAPRSGPSVPGDKDEDGVLEVADACPDAAEDIDGHEDWDGCPDPDNDGDGVPDASDVCPGEQETRNGVFDEDGCPDTKDLKVRGNRITLGDRVHFPVNGVRVSIKSWGLMKAVATFLNEHPEYKRIRINGHTDDTGPDSFNLWLSKERAHEVRTMLIHFGVDKSRLEEDGFGETEPRMDGDTTEARTENRRVEFEILERTPAPHPALEPVK